MDFYQLINGLDELGDDLSICFSEKGNVVDRNQYLVDCTEYEKQEVIKSLRELGVDITIMRKRIYALMKLAHGDYSGSTYLAVLENINNGYSRK